MILLKIDKYIYPILIFSKCKEVTCEINNLRKYSRIIEIDI